MPYDPTLADRVADILQARRVSFESKRMMGGLCIMVNGKMCVGVLRDRLMVRLDPDTQDEALAQPGCHPMDFTGRPMRGFVFVDAAALDEESALASWVSRALDFNPRATASARGRKRPQPQGLEVSFGGPPKARRAGSR